MSGFYEALLARFIELIDEEQDFIANCANLSALLMAEMEQLNWAGFFFARDGELVLGPFQGMPVRTRIAWGDGVCGTAANLGECIIVADVQEFPGYVARDAASRSEMVLPLLWQDEVLGVLGIDSPAYDRFSAPDRDGLQPLIDALLGRSDLWSMFGTVEA